MLLVMKNFEEFPRTWLFRFTENKEKKKIVSIMHRSENATLIKSECFAEIYELQ